MKPLGKITWVFAEEGASLAERLTALLLDRLRREDR